MQLNKAGSTWIALVLFSIPYLLLGYYFQRHETIPLFVCFGFLFLLFYWVYRSAGEETLNFWFYASILLRFTFFFSLPNLSDDVYRFIWDGRMLIHGLNPFEYLPEDVLGKYTGLDQQLYEQLNSQGRPTIYPPISQFIFYISALVSPASISGSVIVMRSFLLLSELGTLVLIKKLLKNYGIPAKNILLYAINPLVILEISGNLHFEGLMVFFVLLGISLFNLKKGHWAAISWGFAIGVKLLPLVFLPLMIRRLGIRRAFIFGGISIVTALIVFSPLISPAFIRTMSDAIGLYFTKFEFNASIYYLVRELGYWWKGWNMIADIGPLFAFLAFIFILGYTWYEKHKPVLFFEAACWILLIYYSVAMIVHPWYIISLVILSVFTKWRWPIVWSGLILLSYEGYREFGYVENYGLIALEYGLLILAILFEWKRNRSERLKSR